MSKETTIQPTFVIAKPDAVRRGLIHDIIGRLENKGLSLIAIDVRMASEDVIREQYRQNANEPWFNEMVGYMTSGPLVPMVWQGPLAVDSGRQIVGSKDPWESDSGSIRGKYAADPIRTVMHGARTPAEALREANLWFPSLYGLEEENKMGPGPGPADADDPEEPGLLARLARQQGIDLVELRTYTPLVRR